MMSDSFRSATHFRPLVLRLVAILVTACGGASASAQSLNVPLTVKETAGVGSKNFPVSAVVPLPRGAYQNTNSFKVVDSKGVVVPAQIEILNRHWARDNSIRHLLIHFQPQIAAFTTAGTGTSQYFLRDDGFNYSNGNALGVTSTATGLTVQTGTFKVSVNNSPFAIQTPAGPLTAVFQGQNAVDVQRSFARTDVTVILEEKGPQRVVIRAQAPARYEGVGKHTHGWALRLYMYAGLPYLKVDYQLQNSAKNVVYSAPLYFQDLTLSIDTKTPSTAREVKADKVSGDLNALPVPVVSNGKVAALMRNFYETWPNSLSVNAAGVVNVSLFPSWGAQWYQGQTSPTGLYWLDDMQHVFKEALFVFAPLSPDDLTKLAKTFQYRPVVTLPTSWYAQTAVTLDMQGLVPIQARAVATDERRPVYAANQTTLTDKRYNLGWMNFLIDIDRKTDVAAPGGWPYSVARFIASENPKDYFHAENFAVGELNGRPQWMAQFDHAKDNPLLKLTANPYGGDSWRKFVDHSVPKLAQPYLSGTWRNAYPRDDQHGWFYHVEEAYELTGNLWIRDWYQFVREFRKVRLNEQDPWPDRSSRAIGHSLNHVLQSYRVTGRTEVLPLFRTYVTKYLKPLLNPVTGGQKNVDAPFQVGYLARALIDYLDEAGEDPEVLAVLAGLIRWNVQYAKFSYYYPPLTASSGTGLSLGDAQAWYAIHFKDKAASDQLKQFITTGLNGGGKSYGDMTKWSGDFIGRWTQYLFDHPELVP